MEQEKILTSHNMDSLPNVPPAHQESELRGFMDVREERRKPPRINVKSMPGKPLSIDMRDIDAVRLLSAFGTADPGFANFMLTDIIKAGCDTRQAGSPEAGINDTLAAVTGIGARDEIEGMLATQMVATHLAAIRVLRQLKFSDAIINSSFGRARLARVATRLDDVGEHEIGEAWVGRNECGQEADCINVPHVDAKRLTRHRFHIYPRWFSALLADVPLFTRPRW